METGKKAGTSASLKVCESPRENMTDKELNQTLALFICEVQKIDGINIPTLASMGSFVQFSIFSRQNVDQ